ncbi:hypothetical protein AGMMS49942_24630 [Spirochaetia bacterium]|nr:hypothetical protein AGMMS49942_24630 [Spirochaetia bacterium]
MMCPDPQMLSLYYDGELPSPWKEKLEAHIVDCSPCRRRLEQFRLLSGIMGDVTAVSGDKERVWRGLNSPAGITPLRVWRRAVPVPLPLVIAAAALILVFSVFFIRTPKAASPADSALAALTYSALETMAPVSDLSGVLQYLGDDDSPDIVIIRLPESRRFMSSGEPAIIRAADYRRGSRTR